MKKILVITWFYPPINSSEGVVTYKLINSSKYKYDVFTQKNSDSWSYGKDSFLKNNDNVTCIFSKTDNLKDWVNDAVEFYKKNYSMYDIVMTRSMPPESHIIGYRIKQINPKVKWIASFGDPIDNNPYDILNIQKNPYYVDSTSSLSYIFDLKRILKSLLYKSKHIIRKIKNKESIEKKTIKYADLIIFNSNQQKNYMLKKYKNIESLVLPHSFDERLYPSSNKHGGDKIKIIYMGHLNEIRNPSILFKALVELKKDDINIHEKVEFLFYGNMSKNDKAYIIENELYDLVKYKKSIDYKESLKIMKSADFLLHIDANLGNIIDENIFFAAKLADYIGSKKPIISITMLEGVSADIIRSVNGLVLTYSVSDIINYLRKIIYQDYKIKLNKEETDKYNAINVAKCFDNYIERWKNEN